MRLELEVPVCLLLLRSRIYIETPSAVSSIRGVCAFLQVCLLHRYIADG